MYYIPALPLLDTRGLEVCTDSNTAKFVNSVLPVLVTGRCVSDIRPWCGAIHVIGHVYGLPVPQVKRYSSLVSHHRWRRLLRQSICQWLVSTPRT